MKPIKSHATQAQDSLLEARDQLFELIASCEVELDKPVYNDVSVSLVQVIAYHLSRALDSIEVVCTQLDRVAESDDDPQAMDTSRWPASGRTEGE